MIFSLYLSPYIYIYLHIYTSINPSTHTRMHDTSMHPYIDSSMHASIHAQFVPACINVFVFKSACNLIHYTEAFCIYQGHCNTVSMVRDAHTVYTVSNACNVYND